MVCGYASRGKKVFIALFRSLHFGSPSPLKSQPSKPVPAFKHGRIFRVNPILWRQVHRAWLLTPLLCCVCLVLLPTCAAQPALTSPAPGSVLPGSSVTFNWNGGGRRFSQYQLWLGTTGAGSENVGSYTANSKSGDASVSVTGIPEVGATLYVELRWLNSKGWHSVQYSYTEAGSSASTSLNGLTCSSSSLAGAGTDTCAVSLTAAAGTGGQMVSLTSNNKAVTLPSSVSVAAGATTASFTAGVLAVSTSQTATLTATAAGISKTYIITLNAVTTPALTVGAASVGFGNVDLNSTATQSVTLTSSGTAALTINAETVTGTGFSISGLNVPMTLNPGQAATLYIEFNPTAVGASTGEVTLTSNASSGAATISLSGTGQSGSYQVKLSWNAPTSSSDPVAGYNLYREAAGGSSYQLLNSSVDTSTTYTDTTAQSGSSYSYYVESVDAQGNQSAPSNIYTASIP